MLQVEGRALTPDPITRVRLVRSVDTVIAMGTTSGRISVFELSRSAAGQKQVRAL